MISKLVGVIRWVGDRTSKKQIMWAGLLIVPTIFLLSFFLRGF